MNTPLIKMLSRTARPTPSVSLLAASVPSSKMMLMLLIVAPTGIDPGKHSDPQAVIAELIRVHSGSCGAGFLGALAQPTKKTTCSVSILKLGAPAPQGAPFR